MVRELAATRFAEPAFTHVPIVFVCSSVLSHTPQAFEAVDWFKEALLAASWLTSLLSVRRFGRQTPHLFVC